MAADDESAIAKDVKSIVDATVVSVTNVHPLNSYEISHKTPSTCDTTNLASDLCDNSIGGCSSTTATDRTSNRTFHEDGC